MKSKKPTQEQLAEEASQKMVKLLRESGVYKLMKRKPSGKYYENLLEPDYRKLESALKIWFLNGRIRGW